MSAYDDIDACELVSLIHEQKFYWLLDLLNGLNAWKLIITRYCLDALSVENDIYDNEFLLRCLYRCSIRDEVSDISELLNEQSSRWSRIQFEVFSTDNLTQHELILISIALVLLRALLRIQNRLHVENISGLIDGQN